MRNKYLYLSLKYGGDYKEIERGINEKEPINAILFDKMLKKCQSKYVVIGDEKYPHELYHLKNPPYVLYYYGNIDLCKQITIAIIGTREPSKMGRDNCQLMIEDLKHEDVVIVSGLALGIDYLAQFHALQVSLGVIAVLGSGIDYCYPRRHEGLYKNIKEKGLIISEFPGMSLPQPHYFLWRNRLIAALSKKIIIVEAQLRSGTMSTANHALELGKDVLCIPSGYGQKSGCNALIKDGAAICDCIEDILSKEEQL